jgi:4-oxalocrotonate tautomerase
MMPLIRVDWLPGRTLDQKRELVDVLTREFARIVNCKPDTISFIFTEVSREDWGKNGKLFCDVLEPENDRK